MLHVVKHIRVRHYVIKQTKSINATFQQVNAVMELLFIPCQPWL